MRLIDVMPFLEMDFWKFADGFSLVKIIIVCIDKHIYIHVCVFICMHL